jgi:hypothetical protein
MILFLVERIQKSNNSCFLLALIIIGILTIQSQSLVIADDIWTLNIPDNEVFSPVSLIEPYVIYAIKTGKHVVVYKRNLIDGKQNVIFKYDEYGIWESLPPGIALSHNGQCFAFVDKQGLKIYNLSDGKQRNLIIRGPIPSDTESAPAWSTPSHKEVIKAGLDTGLYGIVANGWSSDGKYISYTESFYEERGEGIIELKTENLFHYNKGASSMSWSPSGHLLLMASSDYAYGEPGLYVVKLDEMDQTEGKPVIERIDKKFGFTSNRDILFSEAMFSPDGRKITFIFRESDERQPASLAIANADGTGFQILEKNGDFYYSMFSPDSDSIFYIQKQEQRIVLRKCVLASKKKADVALLPSDLPPSDWLLEMYHKVFWTKEGFLPLLAGNENKSRLLILDVNGRRLVYASPIFTLLPTVVGFTK